MFLRYSLFSALLIVAACSKAPDQSAVAPPATATPPAGTPAPPSAPANTVSFVSDPASVRKCDAPSSNAAVTLKWDVRSSGAKTVNVNVGTRLFTTGGAVGTALTGKWVNKDSVFTVVDTASGKALASLQIPFVDC